MGECRTPGYTVRTSKVGPGPPRVQAGPHGSYSLGAEFRVRKERTAARAGSAPPRGRGGRQKVIF
jgi:hypothetical protein